MTTTRRILALAAALSVTLTLGACASPSPAGAPVPEGSTSVSADVDIELEAAWLDSGRSVGIVTWGSSSCTPMAGEAAYADGVLTVELTDADGQVCTKDYAPRASLVALPEGVDPTRDLRIVVTGTYAGETELTGVAAPAASPTPGADYLPSAGWFDDTGFLLLSWGSSTCVPQLASAEPTGPAEVTVTFATPPADQACTADMAPRVTVGAVDGLQAETDVQLVLRGDDFAGMRVPIAGSR